MSGPFVHVPDDGLRLPRVSVSSDENIPGVSFPAICSDMAQLWPWPPPFLAGTLCPFPVAQVGGFD